MDEFYNHPTTKDRKDSTCKECRRAQDKLRRQKPEVKKRAQEYYNQTKDKRDKWRKEYYSNPKNKEKKAKYRRAYRQRPEVKARRRAEKKIASLLNGKYSTSELLSCTGQELKIHLESLWQEGMTWDNYGFYGWHIDHIKPIASFDLSDPEQVAECFHYSNLQPLWAADNLSKGARH